MRLTVFCQRFIIVKIFFFTFGWHRFIEWRHGNIHMALEDQFRHKPVEQGEQEGGNMSAIYVCIGHDDDFVVTQFADIKIIAVTLGKATAKSINHSFNFCIGQDFVNTCFFYI